MQRPEPTRLARPRDQKLAGNRWHLWTKRPVHRRCINPGLGVATTARPTGVCYTLASTKPTRAAKHRVGSVRAYSFVLRRSCGIRASCSQATVAPGTA